MSALPEPQPKRRYSPEEYLALEREAEVKSEYINGEIFAMAGASPTHNAIAFNVAAALGSQLRGRPCRGYNSDMRLKVDETGLYTYPDLTVVCGEPRFDDERNDTLLNPTLIVEVLSSGTEAYDRGDKFAHYRRRESLQEYVLIAQDRYRVEVFARQPDGKWVLSEANDLLEALPLTSIGCDLALSEVYDKIDLSQEPGR